MRKPMAIMKFPRVAFRRGRRADSTGARVSEFEPAAVGRTAAYREIAEHVDRLAPGAVDEASGDVLDSWIDARTEQRLGELDCDYQDYRLHTEVRAGRANAALPRLEIQLRHEELRLAELRKARDAAEARLHGNASPGALAPRATEEPGATQAPPSVPYADSGYADTALLAGRTRGSYAYLIALLFAVGADISAFFQVIQLVMRDQAQAVALVLVLGFTAIVLALAHCAGMMLRDRKAGVRWVPAAGAPLCALLWLLLGLLAAWVRLKFGSVPVTSGDFSLGEADQSQSGESFAVPAAATFLALYLGSGLVAGVGAYLTTNRLQSAYLKAAKVHDRAVQRVAVSTAAYQRQKALAETHLSALAAAEDKRDRHREIVLAFAKELKSYARELIAAKAQDPALTDALIHLVPAPGGQAPTYPASA
ncbi:putative membrane protein [Kutzneria albida DSM 43870]|uniref:Putative membrane protein n=1 Tax=Kutzneria albida DSM 43870 TaxID=1449976 RepID=W5W993_9PSEU|nr:putative membrane protein [Kutzneria albida DSM 43870]